MAAPTYVNKSAFASGTGALSVAAVASVAVDDLILLFVESANQAVTTPSGFTIAPSSPQSTGTAGAAGGVRLSVFYKWATGADGTDTVADSGDHTTAIKMAFRGVDKTNPFNANAGSTQAATTAMSFPGVTTTVADCLIVHGCAQDTDAASTTTSGTPTNANLTSLTERHDQTVASGFGGGVVVLTGIKASAGATGNTTSTGSTSVTHAYVTLALAPVVTNVSVNITGQSVSVNQGDVVPPFPDTDSDTVFANPISSSTHAALGNVLQVSTGGAGTLYFTAEDVEFNGSFGVDGTFRTAMIWRYRTVGGSWTDVGTEDFETQVAIVDLGNSIFQNGLITCSPTLTGLSANTNYEVQLYARRPLISDVDDLYFSGAYSVTSVDAGSVTVSITGQSLSASQGSFTKSLTKAITGQALTASRGTVTSSRNKAITGQALSVARGTVSPSLSVNATGNSASVEQGAVAVSAGVTVSITGQSLSAAQGAVTTATGYSVTLTGQSASVAQGLFTKSLGKSITGLSLTVTGGTLSESLAVGLSGQSVSVSQGSVTASTGATVTLSGQAMSVAQGSTTKSTSVSVSGQSLSAAIGSVVYARNVTLTGLPVTVSGGALSTARTVNATGQAASVAQGTVSTVSGVTVTLTGIGMPVAAGALSTALSKAIAGQSVTVSLGTVSPALSRTLTGQSVTAAQGSVSGVASYTVTLSGQALSVAQGAFTKSLSKSLTGQALTVARGNLTTTRTVTATGQSVTVSRGTVTPARTIALTGQSLSVAQGKPAPTYDESAPTATITGTSYVAISDAMLVSSGTVGRIDATAELSFQPQTLTNGIYNAGLIFRYRVPGGSWTDIGTEFLSSTGGDFAVVSGGVLDTAGSLFFTVSQTGLAANTAYEIQAYAKRESATPANTVEFSGIVYAATASTDVTLSITGLSMTLARGSVTTSRDVSLGGAEVAAKIFLGSVPVGKIYLGTIRIY